MKAFIFVSWLLILWTSNRKTSSMIWFTLVKQLKRVQGRSSKSKNGEWKYLGHRKKIIFYVIFEAQQLKWTSNQKTSIPIESAL